MADRRFELEDLLVRPGTYFNPQTEVLLLVDDSTSIDGEIFNLEEFQASFHGGDGRQVGAEAVENGDDVDLDEEELEE